MKLSILTATYNRASLLKKLYDSIIKNLNSGLDVEWLIMDDGSKDDTAEVVQEFINEGKIEINYKHQENKGKMSAINNLVQFVTGDLVVECDSDDYFTDNAFETIKNAFEKTNKQGLYGICFLKQKENGNIDGTTFKNEKSTMFDLYFKESATGEKSIVYYAEVRKKYKNEIENNEKFVTEARMYHKMDELYKLKCVNEPIAVGEYQENGYTNNIIKIFKENPYGYFKYFEEILQKDFNGVTWKKRLYAIKHYILFAVMTKQRLNIKKVKNLSNKILLSILFVPGKIKSEKFNSKKA